MQCNCFTCPLGKDSYEQRLKTYDALNMGYNYDEIVYNIWCDKIGSKCGWYGYCDDAFNENIKPKIKVNKKMSDKRIRQEKYINKLKRLNKIAYYPSPAMYVEEKWDKELRDYITLDKPYYKRCYIGSRTKYFKKYSNKKVRRYKGELQNGNSYRKVFDLWWNVI